MITSAICIKVPEGCDLTPASKIYTIYKSDYSVSNTIAVESDTGELILVDKSCFLLVSHGVNLMHAKSEFIEYTTSVIVNSRSKYYIERDNQGDDSVLIVDCLTGSTDRCTSINKLLVSVDDALDGTCWYTGYKINTKVLRRKRGTKRSEDSYYRKGR